MICIEKISVVIKQNSNLKDSLKEMQTLSACAKLPVSAIFNGIELKVNENTDLDHLENEYKLALLDHNSYCS